MKQRFALGQLLITPGAQQALSESGESPNRFYKRHSQCDWGDLCDEDRQTNEDAILHGDRLLSAYRTKLNVKFWIITEHDRSATTVLLISEY